MGDQPTSDGERTPEEATAKAAEPRPEPDEPGTGDAPAAGPADSGAAATTEEPTAAEEPAAAEEPPAPAEPAVSAEDTAVIRLPGAPAVDDTVLITLPGPPSIDDTVLITLPKKPVGEDTVIIRLPDKATAAKKQAGEDTVIIRLPGAKPKGAKALTTARKRAAGDDTVIIRLPQAPQKKAAGRAVVSEPPIEDTVLLQLPAEPKPEPRTALDLGWAPWVLALSSLGVVLVALAYAGGRHETGWAMTAYWAGQVIVFSPVVFRLLSRLAGVAESFVLVMGLAANQYMLKWMYSPDQFRFPDELQHWLATTLIAESGDLFRQNNALPPAVHFPGLAEMGAGLSLLTGLPVTGAGTIVAAVAHLMFVGLLFAAVLRASNSPAMAGVACVTYATAMHYLFFNSMFLYATAALPYFMLTVWAHRRWRTGGGARFLALAALGIAMTTVSHHVTAFALVATLLLLSLTELALERPRPWETLIPPALALAVVCCWIGFVAQDVVAYLEAPLGRLASSLDQMFGGAAAEEGGPTKPVPLAQLAVQGLGILGLLVLYLAVARDMILRKDRDTWRWAALVGGAAFFAGNGARFLGSGGPEIAGRLSTFTYVPMSIIAAIAIVHAVRIVPPKDENGRRWLSVPPPGVAVTTGRRLTNQVYIGTTLITLLMIGARTGGWPPVSALLPGPYLAAAYERSVDDFGVDAARWQERNLPRESRVGGDITAVALSSTYGRIDPVREVGELYYATSWTPAEQTIVRQLAIDYLVVDERLGDLLPSDNAYFQDDPMAGRITEPLSDTQLGKFDKAAAISRVYDNGTVRIYRMEPS
ncbi:hypothetical protein QLQ12_43775 [Actinoplanes sp. NEAU-A12]|uniref:Glycosyltransferase RgtA/B/C/D-like domain-containing protein n=1 Tax=Actinoplanes sandaracinus TaxID=3045177 RepID=A0ABT6X0J3_9ACTN|nr:hypothetical protein [Actinoplanes sandaracinus]MDI6105524.1 hypothetical protein [Actinoplanes sandaracinus]